MQAIAIRHSGTGESSLYREITRQNAMKCDDLRKTPPKLKCCSEKRYGVFGGGREAIRNAKVEGSNPFASTFFLPGSAARWSGEPFANRGT